MAVIGYGIHMFIKEKEHEEARYAENTPQSIQ
jgi:hypothetical protein